MIYKVTTSGLKKERQNADSSSILRIYNVGDYPVQIRINGGSFYDPIIRNQHIDITRTATPVEFEAIGGDTAVRTYRVYGDNIDECDIDGILDYDNVTISDEYVKANFVQLKSIAQNLDSPDQGTIPSTEAVSNSIKDALEKIGSVLVYRGSVATFADLPNNALCGDTYNVEERHDIYGPGTNYAWDGSNWDALGSAALDVQAEENFKALVSQSTSEFVNVVENATADINTSVSNAEGFSEAAYTHAQNAYIYRGDAEYFANKAESKVQEASAIKDQVEDALSKAEEIVDPERLGDSIEELQLLKSNKGVLHFNGGNAQCPKLLKKQQFSFAVRIKANKNDVLIGKQVNIIDAGVFYLYIHSSVQRLSVYAAGNSLKSVTAEQNDRIFDGNWHSLFVTYDGITLTLLDEFGVLLTANYSMQEQTSDTKIGTSFVGEMSNVCLFNFDITSEDALYTIADYQQGKPIPPSLLLGVNRFNIVGAVQNTDYKVSGYYCTGSFTEENGIYTIGKGTLTEGQTNNQSYLMCKLSSTIKSGSKVKINLKRSGTNSLYRIRLTSDALKIQTTLDTAPDYLTLSGSSWSGDDLVNNTLVATIDCNGIFLQLGNSYETFSFTEFTIEVNGTILALEDYTFNGEVLDYSGNNNHATIAGNVKGDNDTKVEALYQKIAARISNNS